MSDLQKYISQRSISELKNDLYNATHQFKYASVLDSCELDPQGRYEMIAAFGNDASITRLDDLAHSTEWRFGMIGYDVANKFENLPSENRNYISTPDLNFFVPKCVIAIHKNGEKEILKGTIPISCFTKEASEPAKELHRINPSIDKEQYLTTIQKIQDLITEGEVYELNYCTTNVFSYRSFDFNRFHQELIEVSPVPMSAYLKLDQHIICGASMERFLSKTRNTLRSEPIKGTIKTSEEKTKNRVLANQLKNSVKDRAENVMIVDLVRNDLARVCETGSIKVTELCEIHSFEQVHQMISKIEGRLDPKYNLYDTLRATFPMGSMTGAPKVAAMKFIEELEDFKRGGFSGSVGYITPDNDFDFNVVIRSLIANTEEKVLSYSSGGAITIDSNPESEYEELKVKLSAIENALGKLGVE